MRSKFEIRAQKELEEAGWKVDYKLRPPRSSPHYNTDYFNLFDLIAYKEGFPLRFISIKGQAGVSSSHRRAIESFVAPEGVQKEIWQYRKLASDRRQLVPKKEIIPNIINHDKGTNGTDSPAHNPIDT